MIPYFTTLLPFYIHEKRALIFLNKTDFISFLKQTYKNSVKKHLVKWNTEECDLRPCLFLTIPGLQLELQYFSNIMCNNHLGLFKRLTLF